MSLPINQVERFGKPTWRRLVEAVEDPVGGNDPALALTIARDHPCTPGNHVYSIVLQAHIEPHMCELLYVHNLHFCMVYSIAHRSSSNLYLRTVNSQSL